MVVFKKAAYLSCFFITSLIALDEAKQVSIFNKITEVRHPRESGDPYKHLFKFNF